MGRGAIVRDRLGVPLFFALAAVALSWPLAAASDRLPALRPDGLVNLWNMWWAATALLDLGVSPFSTDYLHYPDGVSLARHAFSPANAIAGGLLARAVGLVSAWKLLLLVHLWLSGWFAFLFARALTGSQGGALLAGLLWSFSPFHFYYLAQTNVFTLEFLPLAGFFLVRSHREGGTANLVGVSVAAALLAATEPTFAVHAALLGVLLMLGGPLWSPGIPARLGARRLAVAGLASLPGVVVVCWPLIREALPLAFSSDAPAELLQRFRVNDLLGFNWLVFPEKATLSWPTLLGYISLLFAALGAMVGRRGVFWSLAALLFALLSLGPTLRIGGEESGIPLFYAALAKIPLLSMLRKPDRFTALVQLCLCVLVAFGWRALVGSQAARARHAAAIALGLAAVLERVVLPLDTFTLETSPYFRTLASREDVHSLADLPIFGGDLRDARANYHQTLHGKKIPQGLVQGFAAPERQRERAAVWDRVYRQLEHGDAKGLLFYCEARDIDLLVLEKTAPGPRELVALGKEVIWQPFFLVGHELVRLRQLGHLSYVPVEHFESRRETLVQALGPPEFEDAWIAVFRR